MMGFFVSAEKEVKKPDKRVGSGGYRIPEERYAAARVIYESTPGMTFPKLAEITGISWRSLENRSRQEGNWNKNTLLPPTGMSAVANQVADKIAAKLDEYGPDLTPADKTAALQEVAFDHATTIRAELIDRHRREWSGPRALAYEAMKKRDFDLAKLAKISSETLRNVQEGERRAWGIADDDDTPKTLVIERD